RPGVLAGQARGLGRPRRRAGGLVQGSRRQHPVAHAAGVTRWICPACEREFALANQSHTCAPGNTVSKTFAPYAPGHRAIYDAIIGHLKTLGDVHEDAVTVGVFLKRDDKFAEVRPKVRSVSLALVLPRVVHDRRVSKHLRIAEGRTVHSIKLTDA